MSVPTPSGKTIQIAEPFIGEEEWQALREPLQTGWLTQGPKVAQFEKAFAQRHDVEHAVATTSCTTALHLALLSVGVRHDDEVIVPAFSWVASANAALYCGARPVLVDIEPETFNIDPTLVRALVTPRTKAIVAVHLFGLCADMDALRDAAPGVPIVEDAACATGATYRGRHAGTLGEVAAFSFHPRKSVTTGEGGMVTTNDAARAEVLRRLRNHGASVPEEQRHLGPKPYLLPAFEELGFNYRMTDLQGAVGVVQIGRLDGLLAERRKWAAWYAEQLRGIAWLTPPAVSDGYGHGWQSYVCMVDERRLGISRNELMDRLLARGISCRPGTHAIHMLGYYRDRYGYRADDFPAARRAESASLAIPLHNRMSAADFRYVVDVLRSLG